MFSRISRTIPRGYSLPTLSLSIRISWTICFERKSKEGKRNKKYVKMFVKRMGKEYLLIENNRDFGRIIYALPRWLVAGEQRLDAWWIFFGMTRPRMDSYLFDNRHKLFSSLLLVWIIHDANVPLLVGRKNESRGRGGLEADESWGSFRDFISRETKVLYEPFYRRSPAVNG